MTRDRVNAPRRCRSRYALVVLVLIALPARGWASGPAWSEKQLTGAIAALDKLAPTLLRRSGVPGMALAVVTADGIAYQRGFGVRQWGRVEPIDTDTVFQLASLSKPLATTVIAGLVGDGVVRWEMPVASHLPSFELSAPWVSETVTLADLLSHRSGLPDHAGDLLEDLGYPRQAVLQRLRYLDLAPFPASHAYTNFGFTAAALSAAAAAGGNWADLADRRLFEPVGMHHASYRFADYLAASNRAVLHAYVDGLYQPLYQRDADAQAPAGGASASIHDVALWLRLQLAHGRLDGETIIDPAALRQTHEPLILTRAAASTSEHPGYYGLGWNVGHDPSGRPRLGHSGAFALGAGTTVTLYPEDDIGIVVLTNGAPYGLAEATAQSFFDLLFNRGELARDWLDAYFDLFSALWAEERAFMRDYSYPPLSPAPARGDEAYCGTYSNPYFGTLRVTAGPAGLTIWLGPRPEAFALTHWDGDLFVFETTGENALGLSGAELIVGAHDQAEGLVLERYNQEGLGVFRRVAGDQPSLVAYPSWRTDSSGESP